jgi:hypothetical protein
MMRHPPVIAGATVVTLAVCSVVALCLAREVPAVVGQDVIADSGRTGDQFSAAHRDLCTPFTREAYFFATPIEWSYRICDLMTTHYRLEIRFRNGSSLPVSFSYRGWVRDPGRCADRRGIAPVFAGGHRLRPSGGGSIAQITATITPADYAGRLWLCIADMQGVSAVRRLAYVLPCRRRQVHVAGRRAAQVCP